MEINALLMDLNDNVATCVNEVAKGELVVYRKGDAGYLIHIFVQKGRGSQQL